MKLIKDIFKYVLFLAIGVGIFWYIYKDIDMASLLKGLEETNYFWLLMSLLLGIFSHLIRAIRWNMLIRPLGYSPRLQNTFLSVLVMYFINLIMPRAGEVARCTVMNKYEKIPVSKLAGTVIVERIADFVTMMLLAVVIFAVNIGVVKKFFELHPEINQKVSGIFSVSSLLILMLVAIVLVLIVVIVFLVLPKQKGKFWDMFRKIKHEFQEGIKSILMLENKWMFIFHSFFIFGIYLFMLYSVFLAFPPTAHLNIWVGTFTFIMGGFAMLAPVQGGIGAWHFMIIESLFLFGIDKQTGGIFALIAHSSTNLIYLFVGMLAYVILPLVNPKHKQTKNA
jgi:uncharacterized protein (TIRG00374 family)